MEQIIIPILVLLKDLLERHDMDPKDRAWVKEYMIMVNTSVYHVSGHSLGQALREAADMILEDGDVVMVKLDNTSG